MSVIHEMKRSKTCHTLSKNHYQIISVTEEEDYRITQNHRIGAVGTDLKISSSPFHLLKPVPIPASFFLTLILSLTFPFRDLIYSLDNLTCIFISKVALFY